EGLRREAERSAELTRMTEPGQLGQGASVQAERYLVDASGNKLIDPKTGEGRRIDFAVVRNRQVLYLEEVTSLTASKTGQAAKEARIRQANPNVHIVDQNTGAILPVTGIPTELHRRLQEGTTVALAGQTPTALGDLSAIVSQLSEIWQAAAGLTTV